MSIRRFGKPITIMLVEDNPGDVRLVQEIFHEGKVCNRLIIARDGQQAIDLLKADGFSSNGHLPDLVLLDLNLPKKNGLEVLEEIKSCDALKHIPVVILTASQAEEDIVRAYETHANCYLTKPIDLDQFYALVQAIKDFWLEIVILPSDL